MSIIANAIFLPATFLLSLVIKRRCACLGVEDCASVHQQVLREGVQGPLTVLSLAGGESAMYVVQPCLTLIRTSHHHPSYHSHLTPPPQLSLSPHTTIPSLSPHTTPAITLTSHVTTPAIALTSHHHPSYHSHLTPSPPQQSLSPHTVTTPAVTLTSHRHYPSCHSHLTPSPPQLSLSPHTVTTPAVTLTSHRHHPSYHSHLTPSPPQLSLSPHTVTTLSELPIPPHALPSVITLTAHPHHPKSSLTLYILTSPSLTPPSVNVLFPAGWSSESCGEEGSTLEYIQQQEGNDCLGNRDPPCKGNNRILPTCVTTHLYMSNST